ncbi:ATP-binding protein [Xanthobacter agilis]|uniref:histidine kinase n=1 Tax=Xanthobacter agilis TaxID=47492 RepID=A0ABU0LHN5_XANAG|nr:ATP-binding protein [Xanthobacter agilis]MDQ0506650.1 two-component system sensor histidine kinase RegB [Xanthobacter agilis]
MTDLSTDADASCRNLRLLIALRWVAVAGQVFAIAIVQLWLKIPLPITEMGLVILLLMGLNLLSIRRCTRPRTVSDVELCAELLADVAALTIQLYLSGGATNPFISLYLLQVILGAVLLSPGATWVIVGVSSACFIVLMRVYRPLDMAGFSHHLPAMDLHTQGMFLCFLLASALVVLFVTRINENLRRRDARLAELRQRAVEEEHVVRMGLLASGAAHELGTPLSTLAVILNDWRHMPKFHDDAELVEELDEMQAALARCKAIVSHILIAAGETRGERARRTTLSTFLNDMVGRWTDSRRPTALDYRNGIDTRVEIASDSVIEQALFNVFDNALEASRTQVSIAAEVLGDDLLVRVTDDGPGFSPEALLHFGTPYQSSKAGAGRGLGLFLAVNVLRKLGGAIAAGNRAEGGARVELRLPIRALAVDAAPGTHHPHPAGTSDEASHVA